MTLLRRSRVLPVMASMLMLAACASSPAVRYYTLLAPPDSQVASTSQQATVFIEVLPVAMTPVADHAHLMVRAGQGDLSPLYSERWAAPLADEFRAALAAGLIHELGALDVQGVRPVKDAPVWRIQTNVQRFELQAGEQALLDVTWRIRPVHTAGSALLCRSTLRVPVADTAVASLIAAQQLGIARLSETIASAIRAAGRSASAAGPEVHMQGCTETKG